MSVQEKKTALRAVEGKPEYCSQQNRQKFINQPEAKVSKLPKKYKSPLVTSQTTCKNKSTSRETR